jgi:hypothetical protein
VGIRGEPFVGHNRFAVKSASEKTTIGAKAEQVARVKSVDNQLEIASR